MLDTEILRKVDQWDETDGAGLLHLAARFGDEGLLGLGLRPCEEAGRRIDESRAFARELGRLKCVTLSRMLAVQGFFVLAPGSLGGAGALRDQFFSPASRGSFVATRELDNAMDAPDVRRRPLRIDRQGDALVLSAAALRVPKADQAAWICLESNADAANPASNGHRRFVYVPVSSAGVQIATQHLPDGRKDCRVSLFEVRIPGDFSLHLDSAGAATLRNLERLFTAEFHLSRCEEILAVAQDCLRARRVKPAAAARAVTGASRLAELHCDAVAVRTLLDRVSNPPAGRPAPEVTMARFKVWELAHAITRACPMWWPDRSGHRAHPMLQLCDDMLLSPLDRAQPAELLGEVVDALDCRCRIAPAEPADALAGAPRALR